MYHFQMEDTKGVTQRGIVLWVLGFMLIGLPAYAYGDPSGGALFQVLMPLLAAIWATWMIFANRVRRGFAGLFRKFRGRASGRPSE